MIAARIATKDLHITFRNRRVMGVFAAVILVMLAAVLLAAERTATFDRERRSALATDREVWLAQGARNPHSAAHFSRYAFKPVPAFASFDPGTVDYAGLAVWMEAHKRHPATFRYAESAGTTSTFASLSPAWVLQALVPLLIALTLFPAFAGEREDGTLRQLLGAGAGIGAVFAGKLAAAGRLLLLALLPLLLLSVLAVVLTEAEIAPPDAPLRAVGMALVYGVYLLVFCLVALGISALCASRRSAAIVLFTFWFGFVVLVPRLAGDLALARTPQPNAAEVTASLSEIGRAYWNSESLRDAARQRALDEYGVETQEQLPVDYNAYELQASEEYADPLFAEVYSELAQVHRQQEQTLSALSIVSPTLAVSRLSAGLAGTDRLHHNDFTRQAELHRQRIIEQMNDDMMLNAGDAGYGYKSDATFWREIADFRGSLPPLSRFAGFYLWDLLALIVWLAAAFFFAKAAVSQAGRLETGR